MKLKWRVPYFYKSRLEPSLRHWLLDPHSMTRRLRRQCCHVEIKGLVQRLLWGHDIEPGVASVREVVIYCDDKPWIWAETLIPYPVLQGSARRLHYLGDQPIGPFIFGKLGLQRSAFLIAPVHSLAADLPEACLSSVTSNETLWARRSQITGLSHPITLTEIFLPSMIEEITA